MSSVVNLMIGSFFDNSPQVPQIGPVGSNHGSLARARARGAGSPRTAQSLLLALGRYRTQKIRAME